MTMALREKRPISPKPKVFQMMTNPRMLRGVKSHSSQCKFESNPFSITNLPCD